MDDLTADYVSLWKCVRCETVRTYPGHPQYEPRCLATLQADHRRHVGALCNGEMRFYDELRSTDSGAVSPTVERPADYGKQERL